MGGVVDRDSITKIVVLVSELVRGRSRETELPCFFVEEGRVFIFFNIGGERFFFQK